MITKTSQAKETSLYKALVASNMDGCDICDNDWEWGIYLGIPEAKSVDKCEDGYDKLCLLLVLNLNTTGIKRDWYTPCDVCAFVEKNRKAFDKFLEEENREGCRPSDYDHKLRANKDDGYYEVYMESLEQLIAGNYSDGNYDKLVGYLLA